MEKLSEQTEKMVKEFFLECIGRVIKGNRKRKNISQETLAEYLGVSESTISRYETGKQDPFASTLPLISHYCDFPIKEFFSQETGKQLADIFKELTQLSAMEPIRQRRDEDYQVIGKIIKVGEQEMTILTGPPSERKELKIWERDKFQGRLNTEDVQPFTAEELAEYLMFDGNEEKRRLLEAAGSILKVAQTSKALTMEKSLAGFVLEQCLKEKDGDLQKRLVAHFRDLCKKV